MRNDNCLLIGIDLGTTYSSISFYNEKTNQPEIVNVNLSQQIPSYICFQQTSEDKQRVRFGKFAKESLLSSKLYDVKRFLGKKHSEIVDSEERKSWSFGMSNDEDDEILISIGNENDKNVDKCYPEEIIALFFQFLLSELRKTIGKEELKIGMCTITNPVEFNETQKQALNRAAVIAGIQNVNFIHEPIASLLAYQWKSNEKLKYKEKIIIIDIGGGTTDICLAELEDKVHIDQVSSNDMKYEILHTTGDLSLGGNDFDMIIIELLKEKCLHEKEIDLNDYLEITPRDPLNARKKKQKRLTKLKIKAEEIKMDLTTKNDVSVNLMDILDIEMEDNEIFITRKQFEQRCHHKGLYRKLIQQIEKCLNETGIQRQDIKSVLLSGGSCLIPSIVDTVTKLFGKEKILNNQLKFDAKTSVSEGAAIYSYEKFLNPKTKLFQQTMPYSIGIELTGHRFYCLVKKGQKYPIITEYPFYLSSDNQKTLRVPFYVGECELTNDPSMKKITEQKIDIPPNTKINDYEMKLLCEVKENGLIQVRVITIKDNVVLRDLNTAFLSVDTALKINKNNESKMDENVDKMVLHIQNFKID